MPPFAFLTPEEVEALTAFIIMPRGRAAGAPRKGGLL
jgi:hypothetical protein